MKIEGNLQSLYMAVLSAGGTITSVKPWKNFEYYSCYLVYYAWWDKKSNYQTNGEWHYSRAHNPTIFTAIRDFFGQLRYRLGDMN